MDDDIPDFSKKSASSTKESDPRKVKDDPRKSTDPDSSRRAVVDSISPGPSTGANRCVDEPAIQGDNRNPNQKYSSHSKTARNQSAKRNVATSTEIHLFYSKKPKSDKRSVSTSTEPQPCGSCRISKTVKLVGDKREIPVICNHANKPRAGHMTIGPPASYTTLVNKKLSDEKITFYSGIDDNATGSLDSDFNNISSLKNDTLTLHHYCDESQSEPTSTFSATVMAYRDDPEISVHSSKSENARIDEITTGPLCSSNNENARRDDIPTAPPSSSSDQNAKRDDIPTSPQCSSSDENAIAYSTLERMRLDNNIIPLSNVEKDAHSPSISSSAACLDPDEDDTTPYSFIDENECESPFSHSDSAGMFFGDQEVTVHPKCVDSGRSDEMTASHIYFPCDENAINPSPPEWMLLDCDKITPHLEGGENTALSLVSFTNSGLFPDEDNITPHSFLDENENEASSSLSASVGMSHVDPEITVHSSCDQDVRKERPNDS